MSSDAVKGMGFQVDLDNCAREPIHVPGYIQPHGVLLAMRAGGSVISQVSNNTTEVLGIEPQRLLGCELRTLLGNAQAGEIAEVLKAGKWREVNPLHVGIEYAGQTVSMNAIVHRYDGLDFVELERITPDGSPISIRAHSLVQSALIRLQKSLNIPDLWAAVVTEVQRITGYDRVMVYKFDRDDHGMVIAEHKRDHQHSWLGQHYPASDIPEQARRLYRLNWIRYIPDIHYKPVELIPVVDEDHQRLTDMTFSVLRSVSPIHCVYLHNMGVAASMSVSILRDERLWGLVACHHDSPKYLPYQLRSACELLGQVLSIRIAALEDNEDCAYRSKTNSLQAKFLAELPRFSDVASALVSQSPNLLTFIPATGAAVCFGSRFLTVGSVPSEIQISMILQNTLNRVQAPIFVTDCLQERMLEARDFVDTASGVLCFTVSKAKNFHVLWFRTEQVQVVKWGGDPNKATQADGAPLRLSPRKSFEIWKQEVRGKSEAWSQPEIEAAAELRATLMSLLLSKPMDDKAGSSAASV